MNARQRFLEIMRYGRPDRPPLLEEGLRDHVLERWRGQGLAGEAELRTMFHYDRRESVPVDLGAKGFGNRRPTCRADLPALRRALDPDDPSRLPKDWPARVQAWAAREHILDLPIHHGFFLTMGVEDWRGFEEAIFLLADDPALVAEAMAMHGELAAAMADRILREVEVDLASFSEPIGGNFGPLISPRDYRRIMLASYRPVLDVLRRRGVEVIVLETYANERVLLPAAVEAGFNTLWAIEAAARTMDYLAIRREFGRDLRLIGGIDLDCLTAGEEAIRREMLRIIPPLLEQGGYIPLADGRVRENVPFAGYVRYRRLLEELAGV